MPMPIFHLFSNGNLPGAVAGTAWLIFFTTFVLEDAAVVGAGLLLAAGHLDWPAAIAACFFGIWAGDIGLYGFARVAGRNFFERRIPNAFSARLAESERWFAGWGNTILISSRIVPGARLPTYLAAGFLHFPFKRFLTITGVAALAWTLLVLRLTQMAGNKLLPWLAAFHQGAAMTVVAAALLLALLYGAKKLLSQPGTRRLVSALAACRHWEFWPGWLFYPPVALYYGWLALKYRGFLLPTAANPGMFSGGLVGESKIAILRDLAATSPEFTAEAELVAGTDLGARLDSVRDICARRGISYPFILKPDVGQRGTGVKMIRDEKQARDYLRSVTGPTLLQRYAAGPYEAGVFYFRFPGEQRGHIFALTEKVFPSVTGDGRSTIAELILRDPRARYIARKYLQRFAARLNEILPDGAVLKLVEAGNHAQGCIFRDGGHWLTPALADRIDVISQKLNGFFIGRYDIRFAGEDDLRAGIRFQIVELNGASSEATNIYDARNSLFAAYRTLFRQWDLVFAVGAANRARGCAPTSLLITWKKWRESVRLAAMLPAAD